MQESVKTKSS